MQRMRWDVEKVIQMSGFRLEDADDWLVALAERSLERCYYLDRAAEELLRVYDARRYW